MMSDFNFEGVVPLTGPVTPVVVFPVVPMGPFVPGASAACEIANESKENVAIKATVDTYRRENVFLNEATTPPFL
jgi:hypothetical protein